MVSDTAKTVLTSLDNSERTVLRLKLAGVPDEAVAEELGVKADWLNDGVRAWRDLLPPDFYRRLEPVGTFGNLTVERLGRNDLILMKLAATRPRDLDDLQALKPTADEIAFVKGQLHRIAAIDMKSAMRIDLYLQQGEATALDQAKE